MVAVPCPSCGAACRISLVVRDAIACGHCGHRGPMPEAIRPKLEAAATVLADSDRRTRQLRGAQRLIVRLAVAAFAGSVAYALVLAVIAGLATVAVAGRNDALGWRSPHRTLAAQVFRPGLAMAMVVLAATPALFQMARRGRKLREACAATPPLRPGEPAACRACGGPVAGATGIVRCAYCETDNVVDASILARASVKQEEEIGDVESEVRYQVERLGETRLLGLAFASGFAVVAAPFIATWYGGSLMEIDSLGELDPDLRYPLVETAQTGSDDNLFCFDRDQRCGESSYYCVNAGPVHPSWIVGKKYSENGERVVAVGRHVFDGNVAKVEGANRRAWRRQLEAMCVYGEPSEAFRKKKASEPKRRAHIKDGIMRVPLRDGGAYEMKIPELQPFDAGPLFWKLP